MRERPSRDEVMMGVAWEFARLGTCDRLQVGAVIHREGRIISTGYNGVPSGVAHCNHAAEPPLTNGCTRAVHAEANAITFAAKFGHRVDGSHLTVTHMPCLGCANLIINAGIKVVAYEIPYRKLEGVELLEDVGIPVINYWSSRNAST